MDESKGYIDKKKKNTGAFQGIFQEGVNLLQKLSGAHWTDYNEHDPGVTILENLAYALTELQHKAGLPIEDILSDAKRADLLSGDNGLFSAEEIFTTAPISAMDFKKLIIDRVDKVRNVWINYIKIPTHASLKDGFLQKDKTLYDIRVEMHGMLTMDKDDPEWSKVKDEVKRVFHAHRNIGEDLYDVSMLEPEPVRLHLSVNLIENVNAEEILAKIYYNVNNYLSGSLRFYSKGELQKTGFTTDQIYDGPLLNGRFVRNDEVSDKVGNIIFAEMVRIITNIDEVISVDHFDVHIADKGLGREDSYKLPKNKLAVLVIPEYDNMVSYVMENITYQPNVKDIKLHWNALRAIHEPNLHKVSDSINRNQVILKKKELGIGKYYSFKEQFPVNYGIGEFGISANATAKRKAQAKQLKAFLLPFEQLMANYLSQIEGVYDLFDPSSNRYFSYYFSELEQGGERGDLLAEGSPAWREVLKQLNKEIDGSALKRLHKAVDNLLMRFDETFPDETLRKLNLKTYGANSVESFDMELLAAKRAYISEYALMGANRMKSFDLTESGASGRQGLLAKMAPKLGIFTSEYPPLMDVVATTDFRILSLSSQAEEEGISSLFGGDIRWGSPLEVLSEEGLRSGEDQFFVISGNSKRIFSEVMQDGLLSSNFKIKQNEGEEEQFYILYKNREVVMRSRSKSRVEDALDRLIGKIRQFNTNSERLFIVEHKLLYPDYKQKSYSFTLDVILTDERRLTFFDNSKRSFKKRNKEVKTLISDLQVFTGLNDGSKQTTREFYVVRQGNELAMKWGDGANGELLLDMNEAKGIYAEKELKEYLRELLQNAEITVNNKVNLDGNWIDERELNNKITFVLPSWPARFHHQIFKDLLEQMVFENAPAYMFANVKWLDFNEMLHFEQLHDRWRTDLPNREKESFSQVAMGLYALISENDSK